MNPPLSALTLTQPWATLSVVPIDIARASNRAQFPAIWDMAAARPQELLGKPSKVHETRGYRLNLAAGPRRIAIHAGKGDASMRGWLTAPDPKGKKDCRVLAEPFRSVVRACWYSGSDPWGRIHAAEDIGMSLLPLGAIIGLVTVTRCVATMMQASHLALNATDALDMSLGNWEAGRWAWQMTDVTLLPEPVKCRGYQTVWSVPDDVRAAIADQGVTW